MYLCEINYKELQASETVQVKQEIRSLEDLKTLDWLTAHGSDLHVNKEILLEWALSIDNTTLMKYCMETIKTEKKSIFNEKALGYLDQIIKTTDESDEGSEEYWWTTIGFLTETACDQKISLAIKNASMETFVDILNDRILTKKQLQTDEKSKRHWQTSINLLMEVINDKKTNPLIRDKSINTLINIVNKKFLLKSNVNVPKK